MTLTQVEANELTGVNARFISLVQRGANRAPFKIVKTEDPSEGAGPMNLNLKNLLTKGVSAPKVVAVMTSKSYDAEKAVAIIKAAGLEGTESIEAQGLLVYLQGVEEIPDETTIIKVNDDVAIGVEGLNKAFMSMNFDSISFSEISAQEGLVPGMALAMDMLKSTMMNILGKAETSEELAALSKTAIGEFQDFVGVLTASVPESAFIIEKGAVVHGPGDKGQLDDSGNDRAGAALVTAAAALGAVTAEPPEGTPQQAEGAPTAEEGNQAAGDGGAPDLVEAKGENDDEDEDKDKDKDDAPAREGADSVPAAAAAGAPEELVAVAKGLGSLVEAMTGMNESVNKIGTRLNGVETKVGEALEASKSAVDTVQSAVLGEAPGDGAPPRQKSESPMMSDGSPQLIDTGRRPVDLSDV